MKLFSFIWLLLLLPSSNGIQVPQFENPVPAFSHGSSLLYLQNVSNVTECAFHCLAIGNGEFCNSFDYSATSKICDLGIHHGSGEKKLKPSFSYLHYKRITNSHISSTGRGACPRPQECDCSILSNQYQNFWVIQNKCLDCVCRKLDREGNLCPSKESCICDEGETEFTKTSLNGCTYCSCETEELVFHEHNGSYPYIKLPVFRVNMGGTGFIDAKGNVWRRDFNYRDGTILKYEKNDITEDSYIYRTSRGSIDNSSFSYHFQVNDVGDYEVTLYFYCDAENNNTMDVVLYVENNIMYQALQCGQLYNFTYKVTVYDYVLDLHFQPLVNYTMVNGMNLVYLKSLFSNISMVEDICENSITLCNCSNEEMPVNITSHDGCKMCYCLPIVWRNNTCEPIPFSSTPYSSTPFVPTKIPEITSQPELYTDNENQSSETDCPDCIVEQVFLGIFGILFVASGVVNFILYRTYKKNIKIIHSLREDRIQEHEHIHTGYNNPLYREPSETGY